MAGAPKVLVAGKGKDGQAVAEINEVQMTGTTEGPRPRVPEAVMEIAELPLAVPETPEAVDLGIPDGPTS